MRLILPHCRDHFTGEDISFLMDVFAVPEHKRHLLSDFINDQALRDQMLDDEHLVCAIQDTPRLVNISSCLYFYVLVRHCFMRRGIDDRGVADYVAELLAEFSELSRLLSPLGEEHGRFEYLYDIMKSASELEKKESGFALRCHLGNYSLFLSGLFPRLIEERKQRRSAPGIDYYEKMGSASFKMASSQRLASEFEISSVLSLLADAFHELRVALNDMTERYLFSSSSFTGLVELPVVDAA